MIKSEIRKEIMRRLAAVEGEHNVQILLAIESGSRAWGFESPDSDYDVRFIYVRPEDWYLSIDLEDKRDVIEYEIVDDIDLNGWDVRKALQLYGRSNPAVVEWVQSPITYIEHGDFRSRVKALLPEVYLLERGVYHYRSMAKQNYYRHLQSKGHVSFKKYLYTLRPILSVMWIEAYNTAAPIEFERLLHLVEDRAELTQDIERLLVAKRQMAETGKALPIAGLNSFIEEQLERMNKLRYNSEDADVIWKDKLNLLFRETVKTK